MALSEVKTFEHGSGILFSFSGRKSKGKIRKNHHNSMLSQHQKQLKHDGKEDAQYYRIYSDARTRTIILDKGSAGTGAIILNESGVGKKD
jgi:hypothetical protein